MGELRQQNMGSSKRPQFQFWLETFSNGNPSVPCEGLYHLHSACRPLSVEKFELDNPGTGSHIMQSESSQNPRIPVSSHIDSTSLISEFIYQHIRLVK